jgi:S-adenosylmethionine synthetase
MFEKVNAGHPDKMADRLAIATNILNQAMNRRSSESRAKRLAA